MVEYGPNAIVFERINAWKGHRARFVVPCHARCPIGAGYSHVAEIEVVRTEMATGTDDEERVLKQGDQLGRGDRAPTQDLTSDLRPEHTIRLGEQGTVDIEALIDKSLCRGSLDCVRTTDVSRCLLPTLIFVTKAG